MVVFVVCSSCFVLFFFVVLVAGANVYICVCVRNNGGAYMTLIKSPVRLEFGFLNPECKNSFIFEILIL